MVSIPRAEYARRRKSLMEQMEPNSIAILPAAPVYIRNRDVEHVYRQDSDFQYLTGFPEPEAVMVLIPGREHGEYVLFCRERDPERELWDGLRAGQDGAVAQYGADDAFPIGDIDDILPGLIEGRERVYYAIGTNEKFDHRLMEWINVIRSKARQGAQPPNEFVALDHLLHDMRLYKSAAEAKVMREAAEISARAHVRAMQVSRAGLYEYHLEAELDYEFRKGGAKMPAYGSIVAAGRNSCILHYQENDALLKSGTLRLSLTFNPAHAQQKVASGELPKSSYSFGFSQGMLGNVHFVAIPANAHASAGAKVVANFLLSPEAQLRKADSTVWGDPSVLDPQKLPVEQRDALLARIPQGLPAVLPEPHAAWVNALEQEWLRRYGTH